MADTTTTKLKERDVVLVGKDADNNTTIDYPLTRAEMVEGIEILQPVGSIIAFAGNTLPNGYLLCDGSNISRTTYKNLFNVIGTTYGTGDGSTTFTLPNLIDRFIEGSSVAGKYLAEGIPNVKQNINYLTSLGRDYDPGFYTSGAFAWGQVISGAGVARTEGSVQAIDPYIDLSKGNAIYGASNTVQPRSMLTQYLIRY